MTDRECVELLQWALPRLGLRWRGFSNVRGQVCKRVGRRAKELGLGAEGYRQKVEGDPAERAVLASLCRVTISRFYRDRAVWDFLIRELLPKLASSGRALRCWSAGCASGEEPYTLALALHLELLPRFPGLRFHILATDVDEVLLERAHRGCYPGASLRELPGGWVRAAFTPNDGELCLQPGFREGVELRRQDLREAMPEGPFELILCRNLAFTYFDAPEQDRVLRALVERLSPDGALVIGAHEKLPPGEGGLVPLAGALPVFGRALTHAKS
ncbi:MAG: CheR family methyltransferase [Myxococcaceae bacterium]